MSEREAIAELAGIYINTLNRGHGVITRFEQGNRAAEAILEAGYRKPRTITRPGQLEALPFGSAVQTSDDEDTVVLRCEGREFRNQSGYTLSVADLWRFGTHPLIVLFEPESTK